MALLPEMVVSSLASAMDGSDKEFISTFINGVIVGGTATAAQITLQSIKHTGKLSMHPTYVHDSRCISLGQDSLSSIATAVASFRMLKRQWPNYPGGALIIDELDAGFHPHAQGRLVAALKSAAKQLDLQIIATTHSTKMIEAVHPDGDGNINSPDSVVYLMDTSNPTVATGASLANILDDMSLTPPSLPTKKIRKALKVYFEDDEAAAFFNKLMDQKVKRNVNKTLGVRIDPMPLGVGCTSLIALNKKDKYFDTVVIVVDADSPVRGNPAQVAHVVKLPGGVDGSGKGLSPERTIHSYLSDLVSNPAAHVDAWNFLHGKMITADQIRTHFLDGAWSMENRVAAKTWWANKAQLLEQFEVIELWKSQHSSLVNAFHMAFQNAATVVSSRLN